MRALLTMNCVYLLSTGTLLVHSLRLNSIATVYYITD